MDEDEEEMKGDEEGEEVAAGDKGGAEEGEECNRNENNSDGTELRERLWEERDVDEREREE